MTSITMTRDDLLANLREKRAAAVASKNKRNAEIKAAVPAALGRVRIHAEQYGAGTPKRLAELRAALRKLNEAETELRYLTDGARNRYNNSDITRFDTAIAAVELASNDTFKINLNGRNDFASLLGI